MNVTPYFDTYEKTKKRTIEITHKRLYDYYFWMKKPYVFTDTITISFSLNDLHDFSGTFVD
jgi:hypothetical protein